MVEKRPHEEDGDIGSESKRPRSNNGSPAPVAASGSSRVKPNIQEQIAAAKARAAAVRERMIVGGGGAKPASPALAATQSPAEAARAKIEAMKARVAAATARAGTSGAVAPQRTASPAQIYQPLPPPQTEDGVSRARGGLGIGLHPALMGDVGQDGRGTNKASIFSKFSTTIGNRRAESPLQRPGSAGVKGKKQLDLAGPSLEELKKNPYYDASLGDSGSILPRTRKSRELVFNQKGKYIAQAAALRRQAQLEDMKRRIAESARKAGLDEDRSEQAFVVAQPPDIEWWDEGLIDGKAYPDFTEDAMTAEQKLKVDTEDSVITRYIQHPVLLTPPQDKKLPAPKPMYMTKEEQAKKRRQERMEVLKENQAKIRLGLVPPEAPKIKKSNLMRVLGEEAVKDPTAVEARVNREIAERREKHEQMNEERKLTAEERHEKLVANQEKDAAKAIIVNVYRIDSLAYGQHRYKIDVNAKQHALTGITILNPKLNLVIVEGGEWSMTRYKRLMLQRIKWTEIAPPTAREIATNPNAKDKDITEASWLKVEDEKTGELRDLSENRCVLIWEGEVKQRAFKKWGSRVCETDGEARRALEKSKMENMWMAAKNWTG